VGHSFESLTNTEGGHTRLTMTDALLKRQAASHTKVTSQPGSWPS